MDSSTFLLALVAAAGLLFVCVLVLSLLHDESFDQRYPARRQR